MAAKHDGGGNKRATSAAVEAAGMSVAETEGKEVTIDDGRGGFRSAFPTNGGWVAANYNQRLGLYESSDVNPEVKAVLPRVFLQEGTIEALVEKGVIVHPTSEAALGIVKDDEPDEEE